MEVIMGLQELLSTYGDMYVQALFVTWRMTAISYVGAMALALVLTVARVSPIAPLRRLGDVYVQIFRNIPGVSLLIICVYALPSLRIVLDYDVCVIVTTILIASAFGSENFMSGINTIGVGQVEAARSTGLSFGQILRHVVIPQALRSVVLPMTNLLIAVMLTTALASQVPLDPPELTGLVSYINTRSVGGILAFFISAIGYAGTAFVIGIVGNRIDKRVRILR
jgi:glutamate transport system permease protein